MMNEYADFVASERLLGDLRFPPGLVVLVFHFSI